MTMNAGMLTSTTAEWYTPQALLEAVRAFYGSDFYDPCPARHDAPLTHDALLQDWVQEAQGCKKAFINPPYGRGIGKWIAKAVDFAQADRMHQVILLVPARTDTQWMQPLLSHPICFVRGRIHFSGATSGAPFPSAIVYLGWASAIFARHFAAWGVVVNQDRYEAPQAAMPDTLTPCAVCGIAVPLVVVCACCGATVCLRDGADGVCVTCQEAREGVAA